MAKNSNINNIHRHYLKRLYNCKYFEVALLQLATQNVGKRLILTTELYCSNYKKKLRFFIVALTTNAENSSAC